MSPAQRLHPVRGVLLHLTSIVMFSGMGACIKFLGHGLPTGEVMFARSFIAAIVIAMIGYASVGLQVLKTDNWRHHASRSLVGSLSMLCNFAALRMIPLADATAISFTTPLIVTVLAMLFLGERIHAFRWTALAIGLIGVLIMMAPHLHLANGAFGDSQSLGMLVAFSGAITTAVAMMFVRSMSGGEHPITIAFYFMLTATVCSLASIAWGWTMPSNSQLGVLLLTGAFGVGGQLLLTYSYRYAEASTIAPLQYTNMIIAVILGYFLFNELPGWSTWAGAPLVIASGLIIFWREYQRHQVRATAMPPD